jgi:hypothetical protein
MLCARRSHLHDRRIRFTPLWRLVLDGSWNAHELLCMPATHIRRLVSRRPWILLAALRSSQPAGLLHGVQLRRPATSSDPGWGAVASAVCAACRPDECPPWSPHAACALYCHTQGPVHNTRDVFTDASGKALVLDLTAWGRRQVQSVSRHSQQTGYGRANSGGEAGHILSEGHGGSLGAALGTCELAGLLAPSCSKTCSAYSPIAFAY